jgi:hypothetical protein
MSKAPTFTLIILSILSMLWLFYAIPVKHAAMTSSVSHAMSLESDLKDWADQHANSEAVGEIFDHTYTLKLGGESKQKNFREMIRDISQKSAVPIWPGLVGLIVGIWGAISSNQEPKSTKDRHDSPRMNTPKS